MKNQIVAQPPPLPDLDTDEIRRGLELGNLIWWAVNRPTPIINQEGR